MLEGIYRTMQNAHAVNSISIPVDIPARNLGVYTDEVLYSVPFLIYKNVRLRAYTPVVATGVQVPYEKSAVNGAGDCVALEDFSTDNFSIGSPYVGI